MGNSHDIVTCMLYWLFVNAQFYAVLCISHYKCIFFFWAFKQFDIVKPIQFLKTYKKNVNKCIEFLHEIINNKHTLLYNLPTIYSIQYNYKTVIFQQFTQYNDTTVCVNWTIISKLNILRFFCFCFFFVVVVV